MNPSKDPDDEHATHCQNPKAHAPCGIFPPENDTTIMCIG